MLATMKRLATLLSITSLLGVVALYVYTPPALRRLPKAKVLGNREVNPTVLKALYRDVVKDEKALAESAVIEVTPQGEFITYGVGIPLMQMRFPDKARGRAAVANTQ